MRSLRIAALTAAGLLALAASNAAQSHTGTGHQGARGGGSVASQGAGHPQVRHGGFRHDGRFAANGRDARSIHDGRFMHDGRSRHDGHARPGGHFRHDHFRHDGRFVHGTHGGHLHSGWVVGGIWYPWPQYAAAAPAYANVWYYCQSAGAYYPYVTTCPENWVAVVPAQPAPWGTVP